MIRENIKHDEASSHFIATSSTGEAVGTVRIHNSTGQVSSPYYYHISTNMQLGRLAVLPPFRGTGLARALCEAAHATAKAKGLKKVTADSQVSIKAPLAAT
jgi:predicted N-acetyltransferase YhbS